jgi:hypothetical protein
MGLKGSDIAISRNDGISQWPTIVSLAESPKQKGVYYTGTDDGTVSMSKDNGATWQNITKNLPGFPAGHAFVSEVVPSRFESGTVYITVANYRQNDYAPYVWMSTDFGATFRAITAGLAGEVVRTLTEDTRNPDVLYVGTETGIFLTLDRGKSWKRLKANFPTVRVDELTIHPRDNALLVATHGRALWILDHLEPIQEFNAAQKADATLFTPGPSLQWKAKDDRNDEFWGHQFFTGENPPTETVLQLHLKKAVINPMLRISDASGAVVRELAVPAAKNVAGIQTVCWDQRVEPIRESAPVGGAPVGGPPGGGGPGGFGGGGRGPIPGMPVSLPTIGYLPENPCAAAGAAGGGGFGRGGGNAAQGPQVLPGTYTVALVVDGKTVESKPLTIVMDPLVQLTSAERVAYNTLATDLHSAQQAGAAAAAPMTALLAEVRKAAAKMDSTPTMADSVKTQFAAFRKDFDAVRAKLGAGAPAFAAGPGGGGGAGFGSNDANVLARLGAVKSGMLGVWESPSESVQSQATSAKAAVEAAVTEAKTFMARARAMSALLAANGITMTVPAN